MPEPRPGAFDACHGLPGRPRQRRLTLLLLVLAGLAGCDAREPEASERAARNAPPAPPAAAFPVRLLPRSARSLEALLVQDFALDGSLDGWSWLRGGPEAPELVALSDTAARVQDGLLQLPDGPGVLVRTLTLPAGSAWMGRAVAAHAAPTALDGLRLWPLPEAGASASGDESARLLAAHWDALFAEGQGEAGHLEQHGDDLTAEFVRQPAPRPALVAFSIPVPGPGPALRKLRVGAIATPVPGDSVHWRDVIDEEGLGLARVVLSGDLRLALHVRPREPLERQVDVPPGATAFTFALGLLPGKTGSPGWRVEAVQGERTTLLGEQAHVDMPGGPARYVDVRLPWPSSLAAGGPMTVRVTSTGGTALVLAQPMIRGPSGGRPNLLFVSLDTLRADHLGFMGYERPTSPALDAFAAESAVFEQHRSVSSYTLPTHASMFTGLHPLRHGAMRMYQRLASNDLPYLPLLIASRGWATAAFTGGSYVSDDFGFSPGFDRFVGTDPIERDAFAAPGTTPGLDRVTDWIEARRDEAWFLFLHTFVIHDYTPPPLVMAAFDEHPTAPWARRVRANLLRDWTQPEFAPGPEDLGAMRDAYDATIRFADGELARLFARLEELGLAENTIVVVTSDHGEEFWEHGGVSHGLTLYEEQLHVPLVVRVPGGGPGRRVPVPTSLLDLAPTLLDLLGLPPLPSQDGHSLAPWLRGESSLPDPIPLLAHLDVALSTRLALLRGSLKLHWGDTDPGRRSPAPAEWQLFDVGADPYERDDLFAARPADAAELGQLMEAFEELLRRDGRVSESADVSEEVVQKLRELGYVR